ncbi:MAG TPA: 50S ribosomal protein L9 [Chthoniobacterales bacterium]|jgi:large subunit ribosomal protein L9
MAHTEVILTTNLQPLGAEADIVRVRRGYARNFLVPQGKALEVSKGALRSLNHLKQKRAEREAREVTAAEELASRINKLKLTLELETGSQGKAFGSITAKDLTEKLEAELKDVTLPKHAVQLEKGIKESGEHEISVRLHPDVTAKLKVTVAAHSDKDIAAEEDADRS